MCTIEVNEEYHGLCVGSRGAPRCRFMASRRLRGSSVIELGSAVDRQGGGSAFLIVLRAWGIECEGDEVFSR